MSTLATTLGLTVTGLIALFTAFTLLCWTMYRQSINNKKLKTLCAGKNGADLEGVIEKISSSAGKLDKDIEKLYSINNTMHSLVRNSLHKSAFKRFNPYGDLGGNQSFSLALLDGKNDGVVISSLHSREGSRTYVKEVRTGKSHDAKFTDEERDVVAQAVQK